MYYFNGKKVTQLPMPFMFINCSTIPVDLEMHINLSCCLWCLLKLTGICNKINCKLFIHLCPVLFAFTERKVDTFYKFFILTFPMFPSFFYHSFNFVFHFVYFKNILPRDHSILIYLQNNLNKKLLNCQCPSCL